jgi:hypothetical protein
MARKLTRAAALQNRAFLKILARTGNVRLAARDVGVAHSTLLTRRRRHPDFAAQWDAALVVARARLMKLESKAKKGSHGSESSGRTADMHPGMSERPLVSRVAQGAHAGRPSPSFRATSATRAASAALHSAASFRTVGGETHLVRLKSGLVQVRRAVAGRLTRAAEQAFLASLSATCNVTLSAAAGGASFAAFAKRRRKNPGFAREFRLALSEGYETLEGALLAAGMPGSHEDDDWRHNEPPTTPPMTVNQVLQLLYLHQKQARLKAIPPELKKRRRESEEAYGERLTQMAEERLRRQREQFEIAEAQRWARGEPAWGPAGAEVRERFGLPDLAQVTGWSRATGRVFHEGRALFGGWRMAEMEAWRDKRGKGGHSE